MNPIAKLICIFILIPAVCHGQTGKPMQPPPESQGLRLSLKKAVEIALAPEGNTRVQLALESVNVAKSRSAQSLASLLPDLEASVGQQNQTRNLAALGIRFSSPFPGFQFPTFVGPFNTFDARATLSQSIFDFSSIRRFQASRAGVQQAKAENENTRDLTRDQVARAYLAALRAEAQWETAKSNVTLAEALLRLAENQKSAGTGTGIEVTRARVQLANENQRLLVAQNGRNKSHLQLLRAIGLRLEVRLELSDPLTYSPVNITSVEQAVKTALESRADWKAQEKREQGQRLNYSAAKMERLPSVAGLADYGSIGSSINNAIPTRTYGFAVRFPVFDGGRRDARRAESFSQLRQENIRTHDLRAQIELEVRVALDNLQSAEDQVKAAEEGLRLSEEELAQAQRRYQAGVSNGLEVTDGQTRLERARDNQIAALFNHSLARIELSTATGTIRKMVE